MAKKRVTHNIEELKKLSYSDLESMYGHDPSMFKTVLRLSGVKKEKPKKTETGKGGE